MILNITYDSQRLKKIIEDYTRITEISLAVLDTDFKAIASSYNTTRSSFCLQIQNSKKGKIQCICSDELLLKRCSKSKKPELHICHAGLTDVAIPLIENSEIIGYILLGRIRQSETLNLSSDMYVSNKLNTSFNDLIYYDDAHLQSAINLAVAITTQILSENIIKKNYDPIIDKAITYIEENLHTDLSINVLCKKLNISKNILYEHFKYNVKSTVGEYITERRIQKACNLLSTTQKPILEIAEECGIYNYTYFIKLFKKQIGITPYKYRANNKNK